MSASLSPTVFDPTARSETSRHVPQCEFASATDAAVLRFILKVRDGAGGDYWWVECGA